LKDAELVPKKFLGITVLPAYPVEVILEKGIVTCAIKLSW
jgi:hypothetical protein